MTEKNNHPFTLSMIMMLLTHSQTVSIAAEIKVTESIQATNSDAHASNISMASQFTIGLAGFAGRISTEEIAMRKIAKLKDAELIFLSILDDQLATTEGKLYALCGLKLINSKQYSYATQKISNLGSKFSTMYGDILKKEDINVAISNIEISKCSEQ